MTPQETKTLLANVNTAIVLITTYATTATLILSDIYKAPFCRHRCKQALGNAIRQREAINKALATYIVGEDRDTIDDACNYVERKAQLEVMKLLNSLARLYQDKGIPHANYHAKIDLCGIIIAMLIVITDGIIGEVLRMTNKRIEKFYGIDLNPLLGAIGRLSRETPQHIRDLRLQDLTPDVRNEANIVMDILERQFRELESIPKESDNTQDPTPATT